jgi:hypothetical protein
MRTVTEVWHNVASVSDRSAMSNPDSVRPRSVLGRLLVNVAKLHQAMLMHRDKCLIEEFLFFEPPLHPRRTLDQAYNWTLKTTKARDKHQVVYKNTHLVRQDLHTFVPADRGSRKPRLWSSRHANAGCDPDCPRKWTGHYGETDDYGCEVCRNNIRKTSRLIMVDQLWMWILDEHTLITSFPRRYGVNKHDASGCHRRIRARLDNARKNQIRSVWDLALLVLEECTNTFFDSVEPKVRIDYNLNDAFAEQVTHC